tara:strand:- start:11314 stop:12744 length:1431 start_codon:yes stop_codon:yes gene_type:complete
MALNNAFGSIKPSQKQQLLSDNYLSFTDGSGNDFAQQYLPEIYEQEVERYGNRTLSGFLRMVGAEMPMTSDQVVWSEQNRLHIAYNDVTIATSTTLTFVTGGTSQINNVISKNDTIVVLDPANGLEVTALVTDSVNNGAGTLATLTVATYTGATLDDTFNVLDTDLKIFVYGSEFQKGTGDADIKSITPSFTQFSNSPIIIKDKYAISGSDAAQIGWVEIATEDGTGGYLWYLKAESETRLRFEDYLEMSVVEGTKAAAGSGVAAIAGDVKYKGTEGLFAAVKARGNIYSGFAPAAGVLTDFDEILKNLDTQGAIEENMLFVNRQLSLTIDNMLGGVSAGPNGGVAYGLFENSEDMALNLGFSGFRRGSYDFYKTDWKYLNDASTRGAVADSGIEGILIPAGTSTVYDQILGTNIRRPFLHVRYRASQSDDRRMKSWLTGSVGGAYTSDLDAMEVHFLSERCLCVQAANNFVLFTD